MLIRLLLAIFILSFTSLSAHAAWVEARSENFIFQGDTSEKKAKLILNELEEYRTVLLKLLSTNGGNPEVVPVQIYGVKTNNALKEITGRTNIGGVYNTSREGPVFVLNLQGTFLKNSPARAIAYHEYTHHLISTYSNLVYPRWYNEGYADYLSTFNVDKKGVVKIGLANEFRGRALAQAKTQGAWLDMDTLTSAIRNYPWGRNKSRKNNNTQSRFYGQSWLAVHYIVSKEEYANKVNTYLTELNKVGAPENLFETTFGVSPDAFGELLKDYYKKNKYEGVALTLPKSERIFEVETKKLTNAESDFHHGESVRRFRYGQSAHEFSEKYYKRAIEAGYPPAQIQASRALIAIANKDEGRAIENIEEAIKSQDRDSRILQIAGHVYLGQYQNKDSESDLSQIKKSRTFLKQALRANPHNMEAHYDYVSTYVAANDAASKQAIYSAEESAYYYKSSNFIDSNLVLADIMLKNNNFEKAKPVLNKAAIWSSSSKIRAAATTALNQAK